jgi:hypothetical protein
MTTLIINIKELLQVREIGVAKVSGAGHISNHKKRLFTARRQFDC